MRASVAVVVLAVGLCGTALAGQVLAEEIATGITETDRLVYASNDTVTVIHRIINHSDYGLTYLDQNNRTFHYKVFSASGSAVAQGDLAETGAQYIVPSQSDVFAAGQIHLENVEPGLYRLFVFAPPFNLLTSSNRAVIVSAGTAFRVSGEGGGGGGQTAQSETPLKTAGGGTITPDIGWNYNMGYKFTPQVSGKLTKLGGYFRGTKTIRLYDQSGSVLAMTDLAGNNTWTYGSISTVNVVAGQVYTVAVNAVTLNPSALLVYGATLVGYLVSGSLALVWGGIAIYATGALLSHVARDSPRWKRDGFVLVMLAILYLPVRTFSDFLIFGTAGSTFLLISAVLIGLAAIFLLTTAIYPRVRTKGAVESE